jgi:hypothetical protein
LMWNAKSFPNKIFSAKTLSAKIYSAKNKIGERRKFCQREKAFMFHASLFNLITIFPIDPPPLK